MKDSSNTVPEDATQAKHRAVFDAWLQKNREQEALSAAKWTRIALFLVPLALVLATVMWYFRVH